MSTLVPSIVDRAPAERILVVDDEPDIVALVYYHLAKSGYRVSTAASGAEAVAIASARAAGARRARPHAAGDLSGFDVLERCAATTPRAASACSC